MRDERGRIRMHHCRRAIVKERQVNNARNSKNAGRSHLNDARMPIRKNSASPIKFLPRYFHAIYKKTSYGYFAFSLSSFRDLT